jgi:hypothetical protein
VLHLGLAGGAFHHWIYAPLKGHALTPVTSHKLAVVKAALAAAFTFHELKLAAADAQASPVLRKLFSPITALAHRFSVITTQLRGNNVSSADIIAAQAAGGGVAASANAAGVAAPDIVPTPSQLQAGIVR